MKPPVLKPRRSHCKRGHRLAGPNVTVMLRCRQCDHDRKRDGYQTRRPRGPTIAELQERGLDDEWMEQANRKLLAKAGLTSRPGEKKGDDDETRSL